MMADRFVAMAAGTVCHDCQVTIDSKLLDLEWSKAVMANGSNEALLLIKDG